MKHKLTEDQYVKIQELSNMQDLLNYMMKKKIGYVEIEELLKAYRSDLIEVIQ